MQSGFHCAIGGARANTEGQAHSLPRWAGAEHRGLEEVTLAKGGKGGKGAERIANTDVRFVFTVPLTRAGLERRFDQISEVAPDYLGFADVRKRRTATINTPSTVKPRP